MGKPKFEYDEILNKKRIRKSTSLKTRKVDEFYSDRSRIIYCSSFRRLMQKAQVFSLEPNSSVRTRLTHSIEVSDIGRSLANKIGYKLLDNEIISDKSLIPAIVAIVENACLLHDIGNPPFGHFGESAIREWANEKLKKIAKKLRIDKHHLFKILIKDFTEFDGNPQGFRIISRLHCEQDEHSLNLTYATLLSSLKYVRSTDEKKGEGVIKKAGYFQSEKEIVEKILQETNFPKNTRYPLTYIMEAADDIAYCLSDISDGIEKRILTPQNFEKEFNRLWEQNYPNEKPLLDFPKQINNFGLDVSVRWSQKIMEEASDDYIKNHEDIIAGKCHQLISDKKYGKVLETIKMVSRNLIYSSSEAEHIELTGYAAISGLLNHFSKLLSMSTEDFTVLIEKGKVAGKNFDIEKRLFNHLGNRYIKCYQYMLKNIDKASSEYAVKEWWLRVHLIIDHISGMTDDYALASYQMLSGIKVSTI